MSRSTIEVYGLFGTPKPMGEDEALARVSYRGWCSYSQHRLNVVRPKWESLRPDLQDHWLSVARLALDGAT